MKIPYRTKTKLIDLADLSQGDISAEDIAYSLAGQTRFNGNTRPLYSVAQHSVLCSWVAPDACKLAALLHDAHEYVLGDITGPAQLYIERHIRGGEPINSAKGDIDIRIRQGLNLSAKIFYSPTMVGEIDKRMLATEMLYFFGENYTNYEPYENVLTEVWSTERSEMEFMFELGRLS